MSDLPIFFSERLDCYAGDKASFASSALPSLFNIWKVVGCCQMYWISLTYYTALTQWIGGVQCNSNSIQHGSQCIFLMDISEETSEGSKSTTITVFLQRALYSDSTEFALISEYYKECGRAGASWKSIVLTLSFLYQICHLLHKQWDLNPFATQF